MRRFELIEGASSKFWEVELSDCDVTVRFGRIGTNGQTKTKTLGNQAAAQKEHDALVKEKTGKGYSEVTTAEGAKLAAVSTSPAPVSAAKAAAAPTPSPAPAAAPTPKTTPPTTTAGADGLVWPEGGFQWTESWRKELPIVRGIHVPPRIDGRAMLAESLLRFENDDHHYMTKSLAEMGQAVGRQWDYWGAAGSAEHIQPERLAKADSEFWLELCAQASTANVQPPPGSDHDYYYGMKWVSEVGIALHGLPFMIEIALDIARMEAQSPRFGNISYRLLAALRHAIAASSDAEHDAAIALLQAQASGTPDDRHVRAYLCPHRSDWAEESIADKADDGYYRLRDCVMPSAVALDYMRSVHSYYSQIEGALLLQIQLHGAQAFELLAQMLRRATERDSSEKLVALIVRMQVPDMLPLLAEHIERKEARNALDKLSERYPAAVLKTVIEHALSKHSRLAEGWAVRLALREPDALQQALPALSAADRDRFQALLQDLDSSEAPADKLPALLRNPPWLGKARAAELPTLEITPLDTPEHIDWPPEEQARHAAYQVNNWRAKRFADPQQGALDEMQIVPEGQARVRAGQLLQPGDVKVTKQYFYGESPEVVLLFDDAVGLALWNSYPGKHWYTWDDIGPVLLAVLAKHGTAALPGVTNYAQANAEQGLAAALPVDTARLVPVALHALRNLKKARPPAMAWLKVHAATALTAALPAAFGKARAERDDAQFGVRWLVANGHEALAREIAGRYGNSMEQALQALLDADPLLVLPARMPKLPNFFVPAALRRPVLRDGGEALPTSAIEHIGSMLAISKLEAPYAGLAVVRHACTPDSLAEFAWDVFEAWLAAAAPSKEGWAFLALGLLGNDETARRLAPRIREWPGESAHQRAVAGLDLLAHIGSDVALMHLNGIAAKVKFKALQDRAKEKIAAVAEARGFTAEELADRLVPDLGLDEQGTLKLDFGPRQFFVAFDESLKPYVKDAQGVRLKDLPKPIRSDDAALADAATDQYKQMKKDAKAIASLQVMRLEMGMVARRRWSAADFHLFFLEHPLMRHLAARVVWAVYDAGGKVERCFRVAEDWTLADENDARTTLVDGATVGIAHVLEIPQPLQAAFGQILADYEILQPFKQLGRETYTLTSAELKSSEITRYANKEINTGSVLSLVNRGWERGQAQDAGWVGWFSKRVGELDGKGLEVDLELDPGTIVGDPTYEPKQRIPKIVLRKAGTYDNDGRVNFERLDAILASEVLRDAELLAPYKAP